jgi:pyrophosphatase PpaX
MNVYDAYLFDVDGTLIDTTELIYRCFRHTCRAFGGFAIDRNTVVGHIGLPLRQQLEVYLGPLDDRRADHIRRAHMAYQLSIYRDHLRLFPGVKETLRALAHSERALAAVTSRMRDTAELYLRHTGIWSFFAALVTPESTVAHKPDPAPARKALELLGGVDPGAALFVGDATYDIQCGQAAGTDTAFVAWSHNAVDSLKATPTYVLTRMDELAVCSTSDRQ